MTLPRIGTGVVTRRQLARTAAGGLPGICAWACGLHASGASIRGAAERDFGTPTPPPGTLDHEAPSEHGDDPALQQTVDVAEDVVRGEPVVLAEGHVDIGPRFIDGEWILAMRDDTVHPPRWRMPEDAVIQIHDAGQIEVPAGDDYEFLGVEPGTCVYVIPQTEIPGVVWLGWNTQDPNVVKETPQGVHLRITSVDGPGAFTLFLQPGNFAPPHVLGQSESLAAAPADIFVEINTHTHANWVFTKPGVYTIVMEAAARNDSGTEHSATGAFVVAVGDEASVDEAYQRARDAADERREPREHEPTPPEETSPDGSDAGVKSEPGFPVVPVVGLGGVAALAGIGGGVYTVQRRRSAAAAHEARRRVASGPDNPPPDSPGAAGER